MSLTPVPGVEATSIHFFDGIPFRSVLRSGDPWFVANEVCAILRLANPRDAIARLDDDEKGVALTDTPGGPQSGNVISEGALYTLIIRCRDAMEPGTVPYRFRRHVTGVVLPSIRRTGSYGKPAFDPNDPASLRMVLLGYTEQVIALKAENLEIRQELAVAAPMVDAFHAFLDDDGLCNLRTAARFCEAPGQLFIDWMKDKGYVIRENGDLQPAAAMRRDGYIKLRAKPDANGKLRGQALVTRGGLNWLRQRWVVGPGKVLALQAAVAAKQASLDL
ncbi:hypothetical protein ASF20_09815 [Methylobacterium sp. Leaf88]|nr:hypothetical protein ASF20_09815 [Methylobacterium sp. Leaf88]